MDRLRLATAWLGGCAGCHMSLLDLDEWLIELSARIELVYSPLIDIKTYPENVDLCLVEGAVCNDDNLELLGRIRLRTKVLIAFGDCAVTGNVPGIRNQLGLRNRESVLGRAYTDGLPAEASPPNEPGIVPVLLERVMPLHEVVYIDGFVPGCPPSVERIKNLLNQMLSGGGPSLRGADLKFG